jgi:hypothetical protein
VWLTLLSVDAHNVAISNLCEEIDASRESTLSLITNMDELSQDLANVHSLAMQMYNLFSSLCHADQNFMNNSKDIKAGLDLLESHLK